MRPPHFKRRSSVRLRPPSVHLRPPLFQTTVFVARNGFSAVSRNQVSSLFSDFSGFSKMPFSRFLRSVFAVKTNFRFFRVFLVCGLRGASYDLVGRETLQNKGFLNIFAFWDLVSCVEPALSPRCSRTFLTQIFRGLTNLVFQKFEFLTNLVLEG